jgi:hypothetical protein
MVEPNFRPRSFGTFLEAVRKNSAEPVKESDPATRIRILEAFGSQPDMDVGDLLIRSELPESEFVPALEWHLSRELRYRGVEIDVSP